MKPLQTGFLNLTEKKINAISSFQQYLELLDWILKEKVSECERKKAFLNANTILYQYNQQFDSLSLGFPTLNPIHSKLQEEQKKVRHLLE